MSCLSIVGHLRKYRQSLVKAGWLAGKNRIYRILVTTIRPPFPPPGFPLSRFTTRLESPAARRTTQHTDSCDRLTTKGGKMEHRGADFNIMLATDSYKVPYRWWFQRWEAGRRGAADGWKLIKSRWFHHQSQGHHTAFCDRSPSVYSRPNGQREEKERAPTAEMGDQIQKASIPPLAS